MRANLLSAVAVVIAAYGCTERTPHDPAEKELLPKILLKSAPKPEHALDVQFEDKVRLIGYDLSDAAPQVARPFKVTWYWRVEAPLASGFQMFTHLSDGKVNRLNLDAVRVVRRIYPEARWKAGDFIKDEQEVTIPANWDARNAVFYLGFYAGPTRLRVTKGPQDSERRAEALRLTLAASGSERVEVLPRLVARRTTGPIKLDGKLAEADWQAAPSSGAFVNTLNGEAAAFEARAQVLYDDHKLYFAFVVLDDYLKSTFDKPDDHLWEQDTVEVMLDPDGDAKNYFELQVSPRGVHFDTRYDSPRQPRPFGHVDWDSRVEAKVQLNGKLNDDAADQGYSVEFAVPFSAFAVGEPATPPPGAGTSWRMNFFVMDAREQGQRAAGWSAPRVGDFHTLAKFGSVLFVEGTTASSPAPGPATQAR
jgi:hypothetical protein